MRNHIGSILLAGLARLAGYVVGRPTSGKWLAHYFMGSGEPMRLPPEFEEIVREGYAEWFCEPVLDVDDLKDDDLPYKELAYIPAHAYVLCVGAHTEGDLYTTVGDLCVWRNAGGQLHYLDVYNWQHHLEWEFKVKLGFLPFSFTVKGQDSLWEGLGKEFLTQGIIPL